MQATVEQILQAALTLSPDERFRLVEEIVASCATNVESDLDEAWWEEIRRRSAEYDSGQVTPIPWEEVKRLVRGGDANGG